MAQRRKRPPPKKEASVLNFEHLIQINDPLNPLVETLTREQLWEGLVLRAEQPQLFVLGLDTCTILSRTETTLERELHYGEVTVRDRVTLQPDQSVRYDILATETYVGGSLTMTIEQPDELQLFLRFEYSTTLPVSDDEDARQTQEIVKSAYRESDIDTVRLIRQYVQGKEPGALH
ncbi:protein of unknown function [Paraburkholderia phenazinium]|uniref:DUF1857 family protein n=1 Tax=Paraburkholderia phenazinium TaxID=60549 RepID=A0A1G7ZH83_9BURK|nr:protein of unknown function [Paraburkholderia phenazinium]